MQYRQPMSGSLFHLNQFVYLYPNYLMSLPLHHSQQLIEDYGEYADFELYLAPTYDFIMKLLHVGSMIDVISPPTLRNTMKSWISDMYNLYNND